MAISLPIIDLGAWIAGQLPTSVNALSEEQKHVCRQWDDALSRDGFVVLVNHGIEEDTFDTLNMEARSFFARPLEERMEFNHGAYGHPKGGYTPPGYEKVALSVIEGDQTEGATKDIKKKVKFDPVENFVFTSRPSAFEKPTTCEPSACPFNTADSYYQQAESLLRTLHYLSAASLGLPDITFFDRCYDMTRADNEGLGKNGNALRLAHYPAFEEMLKRSIPSTAIDLANKGSEFESDVRYGAHTDYQGFTILRADKRDWHIIADPSHPEARIQCGGLEVFSASQQRWLQVKIPSHLNALVINAGDLIQRWTNNRWHSPLHRVVNSSLLSAPIPSITEGKEDKPLPGSEALNSSRNYPRQAIVFFSGPMEEVLISPLASVTTESSIVFEPIKSIDFLLMKINATNQSTV